MRSCTKLAAAAAAAGETFAEAAREPPLTPDHTPIVVPVRGSTAQRCTSTYHATVASTGLSVGARQVEEAGACRGRRRKRARGAAHGPVVAKRARPSRQARASRSSSSASRGSGEAAPLRKLCGGHCREVVPTTKLIYSAKLSPVYKVPQVVHPSHVALVQPNTVCMACWRWLRLELSKEQT